MIRMYGFRRSAASFRVRIALHLKGLEFAEEMIDLDAGEQHAAAYRAINPQAVVPSLFIDDVPPLTQSLATVMPTKVGIRDFPSSRRKKWWIPAPAAARGGPRPSPRRREGGMTRWCRRRVGHSGT
jgi:hypothetical protein